MPEVNAVTVVNALLIAATTIAGGTFGLAGPYLRRIRSRTDLPEITGDSRRTIVGAIAGFAIGFLGVNGGQIVNAIQQLQR